MNIEYIIHAYILLILVTCTVGIYTHYGTDIYIYIMFEITVKLLIDLMCALFQFPYNICFEYIKVVACGPGPPMYKLIENAANLYIRRG